MSIKTKGLVFATFFGSCLVVGLLVASLTTEYWIQAQAKRLKNGTFAEGHGQINFGLFSGDKLLDVGIGPRTHVFDVQHFMRTEPMSMSWWLWIGTALGVGFGLFSSAVAAIASVLKSASFNKKSGTMILLFISNFSSAFSQILAFICWLFQFYNHLTHNVLTLEERESNNWHSSGMASMGHSFYFVVAGIVIVTINIILLSMAVHHERKEQMKDRHDDPAYDEKIQGAIMLY